MDFRTEWSSFLLLILMVVIQFVTYAVDISVSIPNFLVHIIGIPILVVALACIPVLIICYFIKVIPDIDYSIRLAFVYFIYLIIRHFI